MNKRSAGSSFPRFGRQWLVALALLATVVLGTSIVEESLKSHPSEAARPSAAVQTPSAAEAGYAVPSASEVFSGTPTPQNIEYIPSF
ncbi:hypothetical protein [Variovorax sp. YR216]|uniref:hypothetical protein n=1 Tax=Variovorax sp. YR216 TaxID=1882828 RepID=UPI00089D8559|nr:hypothetical protein [Variovorax sp. YR216]SEA18156.1 hypothetical protein SAMN05444680_101808 [Variovorax sp. YR216]